MIISVAQAQLFFLAFTRIMAIILNVPVLGGQSIPTQVRIGFGLLLTAVLIPWQPADTAAVEALSMLRFAGAVARELLIGLLVGFACAMTFSALQIAAEAMGLGSGFSAGRVLNPAFGDSGSSYDQLFLMVTFLLFLIGNGHHSVLLALQKTFEALPITGKLPELSAAPLLELFAQLITTGVALALPVLGALLMADLTLALLSRVAPQVQVFFLGIPLKLGASLILLALVFRVLAAPLAGLFQSLGPRMLLMIGR